MSDYGKDGTQQTNACVKDAPLNTYVSLFHPYPLKMRGKEGS